MKRIILSLAVLAGLLAVPFTASLADHVIWHSPLAAATNDSRLTIDVAIPGTSIRVTTTSAGDLQWIDIGLTMPSDVTIQGITLCYWLASEESFISQIRLTETTTPNVAHVIHDDPTDLTDPGPTCYYSQQGGWSVEGTMTVRLRLNFASPDDWIEIGALGIHVTPVGSAVDDDFGVDNLDGLTLHQNRPNPFGPETTIEYVLEQADDVELQVLDVNGRTVRTLFHGDQPMGEYRVVWDGRNDAGVEVFSGRYYYRVRVGGRVGTQGMMLIR